MGTNVEYDPEVGGIVAFEVAYSPSRDYQSTRTTLRYEFATPVDPTDLVEPHAETAELAKELAEQQLDQIVAEAEAKTQKAVEQQKGGSQKKRKPTKRQKPKAQEPEEQDGGEPEWAQASKPNGRGTIRYRTSDDLPTDALKAMVGEAIAETGGDPELHVVYDERIGKDGLESSGKNRKWGPATVKPTEDNPAYDYMLGESNAGNEYVKASFYVDFNKDGTVRVKATDAYKDAAKQAKEDAEKEPAGGDEDLPF